MALLLAVHDLGAAVAPEAEQAFFEAIYVVAPSHWRTTPTTTLVATEVSPGYLLRHLKEAAGRAGLDARLLLVAPVGRDMAAHGLGRDGEAWLHEALG